MCTKNGMTFRAPPCIFLWKCMQLISSHQKFISRRRFNLRHLTIKKERREKGKYENLERRYVTGLNEGRPLWNSNLCCHVPCVKWVVTFDYGSLEMSVKGKEMEKCALTPYTFWNRCSIEIPSFIHTWIWGAHFTGTPCSCVLCACLHWYYVQPQLTVLYATVKKQFIQQIHPTYIKTALNFILLTYLLTYLLHGAESFLRS